MAAIDGWISEGTDSFVCLAAAHSIMDCYSDNRTRETFNQAAIVAPDGMSLVWYLRLRGHKHVGRVYGPDLLLSLCEHGLARGYGHYFYGGTQLVLQQMLARLESSYPSLRIVGSFAPPFRPLNSAEEMRLAKAISDAKPDVLWTGIGSPKQEHWMAEHVGRLEVPVMIGVGAAFDFLSGNKPQAPRWMRRSGLEWLFRMATEPRRLWPRYVKYPLFLLLLLAQLTGVRHFDPKD